MQSQPVFSCVRHLHPIRSQAVFIISLGPAVLFWIYFNKPGTPRLVISSDVDRACKTLYAPSSMLKARAAVSCRSAADGWFCSHSDERYTPEAQDGANRVFSRPDCAVQWEKTKQTPNRSLRPVTEHDPEMRVILWKENHLRLAYEARQKDTDSVQICPRSY